jgi:hypothetical protein
MDLIKILGELYAERQRLGKIIEALEELHGQPAQTVPKRRGRKNMDAAARKAVSQRMKRYWAAKREQTPKGNGPGPKSSK